MPFHVGPLEALIVLVIFVMLFGVGKLPQVGAALGKGMRQFRRGVSGEAVEDELGGKKDLVATAAPEEAPANEDKPART